MKRAVAVVAMLAVSVVAELARADGVASAALEAHAVALRKRLAPGFFALVVPPFVVVGDGDPNRLAEVARGTVSWAVERLRADFFARDPDAIIDVWLLATPASYREIATRLTGEAPDTPYGFYSAKAGALIMNIATGGGTLVHEIVHPYMHANFPDVPAWYNEGLGSLFEQCSEKGGHIVGLTNWRLAGLQAAIRSGRVVALPTLLALSDEAFYGDERGLHYAEARYVLYYLQEKGLLRSFHERFLRARLSDPTGERTLRAVLGIASDRDLARFFVRWQTWVLGLTFDG